MAYWAILFSWLNIGIICLVMNMQTLIAATYCIWKTKDKELCSHVAFRLTLWHSTGLVFSICTTVDASSYLWSLKMALAFKHCFLYIMGKLRQKKSEISEITLVFQISNTKNSWVMETSRFLVCMGHGCSLCWVLLFCDLSGEEIPPLRILNLIEKVFCSLKT